MKQRGLTLAQTLLMLIAVAVAMGIVIGFASTLGRRGIEAGEMERLRRVYVAVSLYQLDHQNAYPPFLDFVTRDLDGTRDLQSDADPFVDSPGPFPRDPGLLEEPKGAARVSWLYLPAHRNAGKVDAATFRSWETSPEGALLISPWRGAIVPGAGFAAETSGRQIRVRFDGSVTHREVARPIPITDSLKMFAPQ